MINLANIKSKSYITTNAGIRIKLVEIIQKHINERDPNALVACADILYAWVVDGDQYIRTEILDSIQSVSVNYYEPNDLVAIAKIILAWVEA